MVVTQLPNRGSLLLDRLDKVLAASAASTEVRQQMQHCQFLSVTRSIFTSHQNAYVQGWCGPRSCCSPLATCTDPVLAHQDILTGDTIMSGSHKIEEVWGLVYEVEGAWADNSAHKCSHSAH